MMGRIIFLVEEPSMEEVLLVLIPRILPGAEFRVVPHEGRENLLSSLRTKLKAWREPGVRFVVVCDSHGADCMALKDRIAEICAGSGRSDVLVRIVCPELEAWFLGNLAAVGKAMDKPGIAASQKKAKFRNPDNRHSPSRDLTNLVPAYQKISGARSIAPNLDPETNQSHSFRVFVSGVQGLINSPK